MINIPRDLRIIYKTALGFFGGGVVGRFLGNAANITPLETDMFAGTIASGASLVSGYREFYSSEPAHLLNTLSYENICYVLNNPHAKKIRLTLNVLNFLSMQLRGNDINFLDSMLMISLMVAINGFLIDKIIENFLSSNEQEDDQPLNEHADNRLPDEQPNNRPLLQR